MTRISHFLLEGGVNDEKTFECRGDRQAGGGEGNTDTHGLDVTEDLINSEIIN